MARMALSSSPFAGLRLPGAVGSSSTPVKVLLALAPIAIPAAYMIYLQRSLARHTAASAAICPPDSLADPTSTTSSAAEPLSDRDIFPSDVRHHPDRYVVARERVTSHLVPVASLRPEFISKKGNLSGLLDSYLAATMTAFAGTAQAYFLKRVGAALEDTQRAEEFAKTFDPAYISACKFRPGDRVCGVYVVRSRSRSKGRVVLEVAPPEGWKGPAVEGVLVVGFDLEVAAGRGRKSEREKEREGRGRSYSSEAVEGDVRFVNETVMWRERDGGVSTPLEGRVGRWLHTLMVRKLVVKGVQAVTGGR
ncbi:uncharacterized protein F4812DRAFT_214226 [Daldinia caldariorum]|uniref:uncharacterized protein n=1 Tax=Daldinia caldariorum TaxID=326644 RepID=UPI002007D39E|nr:uncharacterized protein F4812DRAFT_214226 [Daldinia caldariorum]KAI1464155.1 hypothetical protein F4812DRAFT_214226 [Daldinia caldariorum]